MSHLPFHSSEFKPPPPHPLKTMLGVVFASSPAGAWFDIYNEICLPDLAAVHETTYMLLLLHKAAQLNKDWQGGVFQTCCLLATGTVNSAPTNGTILDKDKKYFCCFLCFSLKKKRSSEPSSPIGVHLHAQGLFLFSSYHNLFCLCHKDKQENWLIDFSKECAIVIFVHLHWQFPGLFGGV